MSKHSYPKKPLSTQAPAPKQGPAGVMGSAVPAGLSDSQRYARMGLTTAAANAKSRETSTAQSVPLANTTPRPTVPPGSMSASNQMNLSQPQPTSFGTNLKSAADKYFNQNPDNLSAVDKLSAFTMMPGAGKAAGLVEKTAAQSALKAKAALDHQAITNALRTAWANLEKKGAEVIANQGATLPKVAESAAGVIPENKLLSEFTNPKTAKLTTSWLAKMAQQAKRPYVAMGLLLTLAGAGIGAVSYSAFMTPNTKGDTAMNYEMTIKTLTGVGATPESIATAKELQQDAADAAMIGSGLNPLNYFKAETAKAKAFADTAAALIAFAEQRMQQEAETAAKDSQFISDTEKSIRLREDADKKKQDQREQNIKEDEERFNTINENKRLADEEGRKTDSEHWAKIIAEAQARREENRRLDDEAFQKRRKQIEEDKPSKLAFGLL